MKIEEFGKHLLSSGDLDPVYIALNKCQFSEPVRNRWLTAYCAFYSAGFASYASEREGNDFWNTLMEAARNETPTPYGARWPRASERRHFRGGQAIAAIEAWKNTYPSHPERMMEYIAEGAPYFEEVLSRARSFRSVGTWMGFKLVDLVDACMGRDIEQTNLTYFFYDTPKKSLFRQWRENMGYSENVQPKNEQEVIQAMVNWLAGELKDYTIPHKPGKPLDMFCIETIFCKHQSHLNGHYPLYNDIDEITHGLESWLPHSEHALLFRDNMPMRECLVQL